MTEADRGPGALSSATPVWPAGGRGPLAGLRVLDLTRLLPGPFMTHLMTTMGASVIKVEDLYPGDYSRWLLPLSVEGYEDSVRSGRFRALNGAKRSIRVDLKAEAGLDVLERLLADADVLVESFRPGVMERLGLGAAEVLQRHPHLVFASITGYGQDGPSRQLAGHDIGFVARSGLMSLNRGADGAPALSPFPLADVGGGTFPALAGVLAALWERERSGRGQHVDVSMADGAVQWAVMHAPSALAGEDESDGLADADPECLNYTVYQCADGWVTLGAMEKKFWEAFCRGVDREDLIAHHGEALETWAHEEVSSIFRRHSREEWARFNSEHDCCVEPVAELREALLRYAAQPRDTVVQATDGELRLGSPVVFSRSGTAVPDAAPVFGGDTLDVLDGLGYSQEEVGRLLEDGAVGGAAR